MEQGMGHRGRKDEHHRRHLEHVCVPVTQPILDQTSTAAAVSSARAYRSAKRHTGGS